jgi:hypothetical protein
VLEEPDHHADRLPVLDTDPADGVDRSRKPVCWIRLSALVGISEPARDADTLVLLQTRMSFSCRSRAIGHSPPLVVMSGREDIFDADGRPVAASMLEPLSRSWRPARRQIASM